MFSVQNIHIHRKLSLPGKGSSKHSYIMNKALHVYSTDANPTDIIHLKYIIKHTTNMFVSRHTEEITPSPILCLTVKL